MPRFTKSLETWNTPEFNNTLKAEILQIDTSQLPLQQALTQASHVSDTEIGVVILNTKEDETSIIAKTGVFFFGIIAGSCCADDPTPVDELQEYCELEFRIDLATAEVTISLLSD